MSMRIPCVKEGGREMKKDYSVDEMKKIMGKDMEVPKSVDEGMKKAYEQLGIQTTRRHRFRNLHILSIIFFISSTE